MERLVFTCQARYAGRALGSVFGSLASAETHWEAMEEAIRARDADSVRKAAAEIVAEAVPEEGWPHPQRALVCHCDAEGAEFVTPGGVIVTVEEPPNPQEGVLMVTVEFGRDSRFAATTLLGALLAITGDARQFAHQLASAAQDLAEWAESWWM